MNRNSTLGLGQSFGVVFLCLRHYLINVKTNVSNARMNIAKAIRSLCNTVISLSYILPYRGFSFNSDFKNFYALTWKIYSDFKQKTAAIFRSAAVLLQRNKRETGFEPATLALARRYSTTEPLAHIIENL